MWSCRGTERQGAGVEDAAKMDAFLPIRETLRERL